MRLVSPSHSDVPPSLVAQSARSRHQIKKSLLTQHRIHSRFTYFAQYARAFRGTFTHKDRYVRIFEKPAIGVTFLDQSLCFLQSQPGNMYVVHQRQVNVAAAADSRLGRKLGHVVNAEFNQIADAEPKRA